MLWCKCIQKIKNDNGIIEKYVISDMNGDNRVVDKNTLKNAIKDCKIALVNLKLSKDGKLVNRSTKEEAMLMFKLSNTKNAEKEVQVKAKAQLMGITPILDEYGNVIDYPDAKSIMITSSVKSLGTNSNIASKLKDKEITFYGNNSIKLHRSISAKKIIILDQTYVTLLYGSELSANTIELKFDNMDTKIIDIIFKIYKGDTGGFGYFTNIIINSKSIDKDEAYEKTIKILKRQKPSAKPDRRCFDLVAYLRLIYSMYCSYGDDEILEYAYNYIDEFNDKQYEACRFKSESSRYSEYIGFNLKIINELIDNICNKRK